MYGQNSTWFIARYLQSKQYVVYSTLCTIKTVRRYKYHAMYIQNYVVLARYEHSKQHVVYNTLCMYSQNSTWFIARYVQRITWFLARYNQSSTWFIARYSHSSM